MSYYLMPNNSNLSNNDKKLMYGIKNRMINLFENFPSKKLQMFCLAGCNELESINHLYKCKIINQTEPNISYQKIYNGTIEEQVKIFQIIKQNLKEREKYDVNLKRKLPSDPM